MRYADTCLLVSLFIHDSGTVAALRWLKMVGAEPLLASYWSLTEFASAAGVLARTGRIPLDLQRKALVKFHRFAKARLTLEAPNASDFERAAKMLERYDSGLRAGDALHLAICARLGAVLSTADTRMADAASANGLRVERIDR